MAPDPWLKTAAPLFGLSVVLVAASLLTRLSAYRAQLADPQSEVGAAVALFDVNSERNVPTAWSAGLLLVAALLALRLASRPGRERSGWAVLGGVVLLLAVDEWFGLHERLGGLGREVVGDALHFAWVVPGLALALALALAAAGALRRHSPLVRRRLVWTAGVYVLGAVVAESVSGAVLRARGDREGYVAVTALEEALEMLGICLLVALLHRAGAAPAVSSSPSAAPPAPGRPAAGGRRRAGAG